MSLLWIPQIIHNIKNLSSRVPSTGFIVSLTIEHIYIPVYFYLKDENFLMYRPNLLLAFLLVLVLGLQVGILVVQKMKGSLYVVPKFLRPKVYNYAVEISETEDLHANIIPYVFDFPLNCQKECPICLIPVNRYPEEIKEEVPEIYFKTPCKHDFHKKCLTEWLRHKNLCPVCRTQLPPIDEYN